MSYSPFFCSGLLAAQHLTPPPSPTQTVRPDSPILPSTPTREAAADITNQDSTPIAANGPFQAFDTQRPKLRRRRSSLTVNASPLVQLKGSYRGAATATQRQNRSRSGSINGFSQPTSVGFPIEEVGIIGRLRSGSVGNSLRSRRAIRSARPPPSTPLPPLPAFASSAPNLGNLDLALDATRPQPLVSETSTSGNLERAIPSSSVVLHELDTGFPLNSAANGPEDLFMKEN